LHFKREWLEKYTDFNRIDKTDGLDQETTVTIDRGTSLLLKYYINEVPKSIYYKLNTGGIETVKIDNHWVPGIRSLISHLALDVWYPSVKDLINSEFNVRNEKYLNAYRWTTTRRSISGARIHIVMPTYTSGIFDYPTRYASLFSRSFIINFTLAKFFLNKFDYSFLKEIAKNSESIVNEQLIHFKSMMGVL
jgi:hypothetical protein